MKKRIKQIKFVYRPYKEIHTEQEIIEAKYAEQKVIEYIYKHLVLLKETAR